VPARRITWLGHATVLMEIGGARLLTDPVLGGRVAHLRRHAPTPADPRPVDAVLISHIHRDHLDRASLRSVAGPDTLAVLPHGGAGLLRGLPFAAVREVRAGEAVALATAVVRAVPAWHVARRRPGGRALDAVGFLVDGVWFAGDTGLDEQMAELRGSVEAALVPVWGWGASLGPGHLDPEAAARAVALVRPAVAVPIHWGTFLPIGLRRRHRRLLTEPAAAFAAHAERLAPSTRVATLAVGGSLSL
jgi:L-ascorbate metabolism protein UlaG (beta-lactamase superfamily)